MNKYFFTFGSGHHGIYGESLSRHYIVIEAENELEARKTMFAHNGAKWASCYSEERFAGQAVMYDYTEVSIWDVEVCCGQTQLEYDELLQKYEALKEKYPEDEK